MGIEEFVVKGKHELDLSCFKIIPEGEVKGVIQVFHGMGEHKKRYHHFAKYMAKNGFAVYAHDHRKHGLSVKSPEEVGIFTREDTWADVLLDCNFVNRKIQKDLPDVPIIIMGHSMGSIIARKYISNYEAVPKMAILSGTLPPIGMGRAWAPLFLTAVIGLFMKDKRIPFIAKLLNDPLNKSFTIKRTKFDWLSNDIRVVDKYIADPLCGYAYSKRFYKEFFHTMIDVNKSDIILETNDIPLLFISGKDDPVGEFGEGVKKTRELYSGHGYTQLTTKLIEGNRHEVLNEKEKTATFKYLIEWINSNL